MAFPWMAIAGIASGLLGARSANQAANAQTAASNAQMALQREVYEDQTQRFAPFLGAGTNALAAYNFELGMGDAPEGYQGYTMSPAGQFALTQGRDAIEAGAAARGGMNSGSTLQALERFRMGLATQDRDSYLNRLGGMVDMGQGSAGMQAQAGNAYAGMASNALANRGDAQAAGAIGTGNAWQNALGNVVGAWQYNQAQQPQQQGGGWWQPRMQ